MNIRSMFQRDDRIRLAADPFPGANGEEFRADQELRVHRTGLGGKAIISAYDETGARRMIVRQPGGQHVVGCGLISINRGSCSDIAGIEIIESAAAAAAAGGDDR